MRICTLIVVLALGACRPASDTGASTNNNSGPIDNDGDGASDAEDCNDDDPTINPYAEELCDGIDNDCNGTVDDGATDATTYYADFDDDGYGNATVTVEGCDTPAGYTSDASDCNDADAAWHPGAVEECTDPSDLNCDGSVGYADADGDGHAACEECDDSSGQINPNAVELCDGVDNDCDGTVDGPGAFGGTTWYSDGDGDGFGDATDAQVACDEPTDHVANDDDCNDGDNDVHPGADELCNDEDDDCDSNIDEQAIDQQTWHADIDGDGHGGPGFTTEACDQPSGYTDVVSADDCDDLDGDVYPGGSESCDGADNNCDSSIDEGFPNNDGDADADCVDDDDDNDGVDDDDDNCEFVSNVSQDNFDGDAEGDECDADDDNDGSLDAPDCDAYDATAYPGATEICNGADSDCDGQIDLTSDGTSPCLFGGGIDGDITVTSSRDLNEDPSNGRTEPDGVAYQVVTSPDSTNTVDVASAPDGLAAGDKAILINMRGSQAANGAVGTWDLVDIIDVSGNTITFGADITQAYTSGNLSDQAIVLQRVPQYDTVTVSGSGVLTAAGWDNMNEHLGHVHTGMVALMAADTVTVSGGGIDVSGRGFRGGETGVHGPEDALHLGFFQVGGSDGGAAPNDGPDHVYNSGEVGGPGGTGAGGGVAGQGGYETEPSYGLGVRYSAGNRGGGGGTGHFSSTSGGNKGPSFGAGGGGVYDSGAFAGAAGKLTLGGGAATGGGGGGSGQTYRPGTPAQGGLRDGTGGAAMSYGYAKDGGDGGDGGAGGGIVWISAPSIVGAGGILAEGMQGGSGGGGGGGGSHYGGGGGGGGGANGAHGGTITLAAETNTHSGLLSASGGLGGGGGGGGASGGGTAYAGGGGGGAGVGGGGGGAGGATHTSDIHGGRGGDAGTRGDDSPTGGSNSGGAADGGGGGFNSNAGGGPNQFGSPSTGSGAVQGSDAVGMDGGKGGGGQHGAGGGGGAEGDPGTDGIVTLNTL